MKYLFSVWQELIQILKREQEEDHYDAFILVILSYGGVGTVVCRDGKEVPLRDILNVFSNENCPKLKDKPKLFFIQACGTRFNGERIIKEFIQCVLGLPILVNNIKHF